MVDASTKSGRVAPGSLRSSYERHAPWLAPEQKAAWDAFIRMQEKLIGRLSRQIQADSRLSAADYLVLAKLTE